MNNIYVYGDDFDRAAIIDKINCIADEIKEEQSKPFEERDFDKEKQMIYAQFIQGLKLSTGNNYF